MWEGEGGSKIKALVSCHHMQQHHRVLLQLKSMTLIEEGPVKCHHYRMYPNQYSETGRVVIV